MKKTKLYFLWREYYSYLWLYSATARFYFIKHGYFHSLRGQTSAYATTAEIQSINREMLKNANNDSIISDFERELHQISKLVKNLEPQFSALTLKNCHQSILYKKYQILVNVLCRFINIYRYTEPQYVSYFEKMAIKNLCLIYPDKSSDEIHKTLVELLSRLKKLNLNKKSYNKNIDYSILKTINTISRLRFQSKKIELLLSTCIYNWTREVAYKTILGINQISNFSPLELKNLLCNKEKPDLSLINARQKEFVLEIKNKNKSIVIAEKNPIIFNKILQKQFSNHGSVLTGLIAYPGKTTGSVRIVPALFDMQNYNNFIASLKKNDILVAPMTSPLLARAFNIVAAVITDEGGLMSHAALLSREKKIPCIVGTHMATKYLHEGDCVFVDAQEGVIKKITNKHAK